MGERVAVEFDAGDFPCLAGVLQDRLNETQRHQRICGDRYSAEESQMIDVFIQQLNGCLRAVSAAREQYLRGSANITTTEGMK